MLKVSVVVPTRDRSKDLADLLLTIINQNYLPLEVIIVDDSPADSVKQVVDSLDFKFRSLSCKLRYVKGDGDGLPAARNLGVKLSRGEIILFLDDDTLLDQNVIDVLTAFLREKPTAIGVQPRILRSRKQQNYRLAKKLVNIVCKALMLTYYENDKLRVRRSGYSILPNNLTKVILAQRLSGCCCCYRRSVFCGFSFDTNLKRWGYMEDLDFSYRVGKKHPKSLYAVPHAKIIHKASEKTKLRMRARVYMTTIYWFYVFFKDIFESSILNLIAFLWALTGNLVTTAGELITKRKPKPAWWGLIHLLNSYAVAFSNLKHILKRKLEFFNESLNH